MILALIMMIGLIVAFIAVFTTISPPERGLWVAVGDDYTGGYGNIMYSADGKKWEETKSGASFSGTGSNGSGVAYGKDKWVAVGYDRATGGYANIISSTDGKVWEETKSGASFSTRGYSVAYGKDKWVAVGDDDGGYGSIMYSTDGKVWVDSSEGGASFSGSVSSGLGVAYSSKQDLWVAVGKNSAPGYYGNIMWSNDGMCWVISGMGSDEGEDFGLYGSDVAYSSKQNRWVAVGYDNNDGGYGSIMYSADGKIWLDSNSGDSFSGSGSSGIGIAYSSKQDLWVAVGNDGTEGGYGSIMWSNDGMCWVKTNEGASFVLFGRRVAYSSMQDLWVAVGEDGGGYGNIMYSKDGKVWEVSSDKGDSFYFGGLGVAFGGV